MTEHESIICQLHAKYCALTAFELRLLPQREYAWHQYVTSDFTEDDLCVVIRFLKHQIKQDLRRPQSLKFHNLIDRLDLFEEDLQEALAWRRNTAPREKTHRTETLAAAGRPVTTTGNAQPVKDVVERIVSSKEMFDGLRESIKVKP